MLLVPSPRQPLKGDGYRRRTRECMRKNRHLRNISPCSGMPLPIARLLTFSGKASHRSRIKASPADLAVAKPGRPPPTPPPPAAAPTPAKSSASPSSKSAMTNSLGLSCHREQLSSGSWRYLTPEDGGTASEGQCGRGGGRMAMTMLLQQASCRLQGAGRERDARRGTDSCRERNSGCTRTLAPRDCCRRQLLYICM